MAEQLRLIAPSKPRWALDEATKEAGRRGIAASRAALAEHRPDDQQTRRAS